MRPEVVQWLEETLPALTGFFEQEIGPEEEFDAFLAGYAAGEPLVYERQLWPLFHHSSGIWELKTRDLRLFGWFWRRDCFICSRIDDATHVKAYSLYAGYRDEAVRFRDSLDLDPPKFIEGDHPSAVVSAFSFP